jgi:hypothetical protein
LALQLTTQGVLQVVTDPKKADSVLTDGVGARFEETLTAIYGAPVDKDQSEKDSQTEFTHPSSQRLSSSAGVVFLVNRVSRDVLWSTFEQPKNTRPEDMKNTAKKIVERLAKSNSPGKSHD